jgi:hypothetical protein
VLLGFWPQPLITTARKTVDGLHAQTSQSRFNWGPAAQAPDSPTAGGVELAGAESPAAGGARASGTEQASPTASDALADEGGGQ